MSAREIMGRLLESHEGTVPSQGFFTAEEVTSDLVKVTYLREVFLTMSEFNEILEQVAPHIERTETIRMKESDDE